MVLPRRPGALAAIAIAVLLAASYGASAVVTAHESPVSPATLSSTATSTGSAAVSTTPLQQALASLASGAGPARGATWSCDAQGQTATNCGPSSPGAEPRGASDSAVSSNLVEPAYLSSADLDDVNWTNQTEDVGSGFAVADNGVASYDPGLGEVILFGGGNIGCYYAGGCQSNNTWIYSNGTWHNETAFYDAFGAPPAVVGATFTYDPAWDGSILTGGAFGDTLASPYTWLFSGNVWFNITGDVLGGPSTVFGSAAYDSVIGGLVYINGCSEYFCNLGEVEGLTWFLGAPGSEWQNISADVGVPDGYSFGSEMVYDPALSELVFYSGGFVNVTTGQYHVTNDTWVLYSTDTVWTNVSTTSSGIACILTCFPTYPLGSGFGAMTWDGQLDAIVLFGGIDQYGYVTDQTYVFAGGYWYPYWVYNFNAALPPAESFMAMPTNSSSIAPIMLGGNCQEDQALVLYPDYLSYAADSCDNASWVFEIPPEPFITVVGPSPADYGTPILLSMYNAVDSGSGPNLTVVLFFGFFEPIGPHVYEFLNFTLNDTYTDSVVLPTTGTWDVGVYVIDYFDVFAYNYTFVEVNQNLTAAPAASPITTEIDQAGTAEVNFTANAVDGQAPYTYAWAFGAGQGTSTAANPTYDYTAAGTFSVTLKVTDSFGWVFDTGTTVVVFPKLTASIAANATGGSDAGGAVSFTGTPGGGSGGDTYEWSSGDGGTVTTEDAVFTYPTAGSYTVSYTVTDNLGFKVTSTYTMVVNADLGAAPTASSVTPSAGSSVSFDAHATGGTAPLTYAWKFGDGATATGATPSYSYPTNGTYTVTVTVTDAYGEHVTKTLTEKVSKASSSPAFSFTSGIGLDVLIAIAAIVLVAIAALLLSRRRKKEPASAPPAAWQGSPSGTPGASPPGAPPAAGGGTPPTPPPSGGT